MPRLATCMTGAGSQVKLAASAGSKSGTGSTSRHRLPFPSAGHSHGSTPHVGRFSPRRSERRSPEKIVASRVEHVWKVAVPFRPCASASVQASRPDEGAGSIQRRSHPKLAATRRIQRPMAVETRREAVRIGPTAGSRAPSMRDAAALIRADRRSCQGSSGRSGPAPASSRASHRSRPRPARRRASVVCRGRFHVRRCTSRSSPAPARPCAR